MQTAIPDRLTERKYEQNDQKYPISPRESNKKVNSKFSPTTGSTKSQICYKTTHVTLFKNMNGVGQSFSAKYYWTKNSLCRQSPRKC